MHDGHRFVVSEFLVQVLQALDDPLCGVSIVAGGSWGISTLRLTSLMFVVPERAARDSSVILLDRTDVLGVG